MNNIKELTKLTTNLKVLYVEDNKATRDKTLQLLKNFFNNITIAVDGTEGLNKFKKDKMFDLILTDINMPKMNGIDMIKNIRAINNDIPCIILSAHDDINYFIDTIRLCVDGYILKPIEMSQLTDILYKIMEKNKFRNENLKYKQNLEDQVKLQLEELRQKDKILIHQSKLAAMGEMIDAVAHQWKQPLNAMTVSTSGLKAKFDFDINIDDNEMLQYIDNTQKQIDYLVETIDEFRGFFKEKSDIQKISIKSVIDSALLLTKEELIKYTIKTKFIGNTQVEAEIIPNEFKHIIITLINNAKDEFIRNKIKDPCIIFELSKDKNKDEITLEIKDNAGGIPDNIIKDIFNANFTTKKDNKGTGIGLYMSRNIIEKIDGKISVKNENGGASFKINI